MLEDQPNGPLPNLWAVSLRRVHGSILSRTGVSDNPGAVHFSEAAVLFLKGNPRARAHLKRLQRKHGKAKALPILAARLGRSVYFMLKNQEAFDMNRFFA